MFEDLYKINNTLLLMLKSKNDFNITVQCKTKTRYSKYFIVICNIIVLTIY